jgi:hypothetical protein
MNISFVGPMKEAQTHQERKMITTMLSSLHKYCWWIRLEGRLRGYLRAHQRHVQLDLRWRLDYLVRESTPKNIRRSRRLIKLTSSQLKEVYLNREEWSKRSSKKEKPGLCWTKLVSLVASAMNSSTHQRPQDPLLHTQEQTNSTQITVRIRHEAITRLQNSWT